MAFGDMIQMLEGLNNRRRNFSTVSGLGIIQAAQQTLDLKKGVQYSLGPVYQVPPSLPPVPGVNPVTPSLPPPPIGLPPINNLPPSAPPPDTFGPGPGIAPVIGTMPPPACPAGQHSDSSMAEAECKAYGLTPGVDCNAEGKCVPDGMHFEYVNGNWITVNDACSMGQRKWQSICVPVGVSEEGAQCPDGTTVYYNPYPDDLSDTTRLHPCLGHEQKPAETGACPAGQYELVPGLCVPVGSGAPAPKSNTMLYVGGGILALGLLFFATRR